MAVEKVGEKYKCNVCGNEVTVTKVGGGELVCCGQPMEKTAGQGTQIVHLKSSATNLEQSKDHG